MTYQIIDAKKAEHKILVWTHPILITSQSL